jgi:hypothetical protein
VSVPPSGRQADAYVPRTKLLVLGIVLSVWGLGIVLRGLASTPQGESAYASGQRLAVVLGAAMLVVGVRQLWLEYRARRDAAS